jgi:Xaa-Pro aminopeptidase
MRRLPESEFTTRHGTVRQMLAKRELDAAFVYYDELRSAAGWYLCGWCPQFESGAVVVPAEGEPAILGGPESEPFAKLDSRVPKTYNATVFMVPDEEYPTATIHTLAAALEDIVGSVPQRLGCVGTSIMPAQVLEQLRDELPETELVDITSEFEALRIIKTAAEIDILREAFAINEQAYDAMRSAVAPGVPEFALAAAAEGRARGLGADWFGFRTIVASGPRAAGVVPTASDRLLAEGEYVMAGFSCKLDGYATASGNMFAVGEVNGQRGEIHRDLIEAFKLARDQLRPGLVGKEMDAPVRAFLEGKDYAPYLLIPFFHTQGLNEADPPFFGPRSDDRLEENMIVAIDVSMFGHPQMPGARLETVYAITADGAEALSPGVEADILAGA